MARLVIRGAQILPMASDDAVVVQGDLVIKGSRIAAVGGDAGSEPGDTVIAADGMAALPGLINCHNHAAMTLFRGYCDDLRLMDWLTKKIWPAEAKLTGEEVYWGTLLAAAEMIRSGTTTFADMYFFLDDVARAVAEAGMRCAIAQGLIFVDDRGMARLQTARSFLERWQGGAGGRITHMVAPHAPYTVPPESFRQCMALAREFGVPIHTHLAETVEEVDQIFAQYGKSPTRFLADLGVFADHHVLLAHSIHLSRDDLHLLRGTRAAVAHNPVSNLKLACGIAPVVEFRRLGVTCGLGTDGAGSASTLDMWKEIRAAAWLQKHQTGDPTAMTAYQALQLATREGARALALGDRLGTLEVGKQADLILVNLQAPHLTPNNDVFALLAYCAAGSDVDTVIVDGQVLMAGGRIRTLDVPEVMRQASACARRLLS